ncbi:MAG: hypothetical protein GEU75_15615 [Dehalococcoidia bacterium]|nr:hypothetical protein [Dehalococcoidia bacterium]
MKAQSAIYQTEHSLAWLMSLGAIVLAVIGALVAFDVLDIRNVFGGAESLGAVQNFEDAVLLLLPAIALSLLAWTLHSGEHHLGARYATTRDEAMYKSEHSLAYIAALAALVFVALGILAGFDVLDNGNTWRDGVTWNLLAIISATLTATLHAVTHHKAATEQEDIRMIIDERVGSALQRAGSDVRVERGYERG